MADPAVLDAAAAALRDAERERRPITPLVEAFGPLEPVDAYAIQQRIVAARLADGESIVGWKLGLTSAAMQTQLGVDQPDYAPILSGQLLPDGVTIEHRALIAPRVEAEIAVRLGAPLRGPGISAEDVAAVADAIAPAIEVIDSRIADWRITLVDTIADLASCGRVVVGSWQPIPASDLRLLGVVLDADGDVAATGAGAACLGHPFRAVAWAANTLGPLGVTLPAGVPIMPGALHASVPAVVGSTFTARFDRIGTVSVGFA